MSDFTSLPPASFTFLILSLRAQAEMQLGLVHFGPEEDRQDPDLMLARHSIDLMAMLLEKTKGNRTAASKLLGLTTRTLSNKIRIYRAQGFTIIGGRKKKAAPPLRRPSRA